MFIPKNCRKYCSVNIKKRIVVRKYKPIINWINEDVNINDQLGRNSNSNDNNTMESFSTIEFGTFLTEKYFKVHVFGVSDKKETIMLTNGDFIFSHKLGSLLEGKLTIL